MGDILHVLDMLAWFPENISTFGAELDSLFAIIYWVSVAIFFLTFGILGYFLVKYRYSPDRKGYNYHGNNIVEITWTILPTFLFAAIGLYSDDIWERTKYSKRVPTADVEILVLGKQFGWLFMYPGADGSFGRNAYNDRTARSLMTATNPFGIDSTDPAGADDFITENQFRVPVNSNVVVRGSSIDVLHSFFLPHARVKQDVVPGTWMNIWFNLFKTGKYELACAELCGGGHYAMRAEYQVMSKAGYDTWLDTKNAEVKAARSPQPAPTAPADTAAVASLR
ncbi:MAG: cytochrome c oxidase subunit II [Ignavibacteria bacterium]|nr:cytochrome c oxidase subunit II [Ignavibacteria bacterium]MBP6510460.1 cytochrome c oxidase subunit II [Candidatus Kapabacteria bacterium]MBK6417824.1 cytochrome c oxidase subunit II [Ignavibacteria bacterium]MBK6760853.1 cytochrome c oxidase subunit II [Ignavibacteria bacterium]MBK7031859.1 cytochrome c oxidase subunit II [Ignavibacteria bacterium]